MNSTASTEPHENHGLAELATRRGWRHLEHTRRGNVWGCPYDGSRRRVVMELESGGHGGPFLDGEWFASDTPPGHGKFPGSIICFRTDGSQECQVLFQAMASHYSHAFAGWHPDHHSTHPHPNSSPDGTKVIFSSDFLGEYTDVYVVLNRSPDPPRNLAIQTSGSEATLHWERPEQCRETRGYLVYRRSDVDADFERLTDEPVNGTQWRIPVTAVDRSGNESAPSEAASARTPSFDPVRIELRTEDAAAQGMNLSDGNEEGRQVLAPDEEDQNPSASWDFEVPRSGVYAIWGRSTFDRPEDQSKGRGPGKFIPQFELSIDDGPAIEWQAWGFWGEWHWSPAGRMVTGSPELFQLEQGRHTLRLRPKTATSVVSAIVIADDPTWWPVEGMKKR